MHSHRIEDLLHRERTDESRSQLLRLRPQWYVFRGEPYLLANLVNRSQNTMMARQSLVLLCCPKQCCPSSPPCLPAMTRVMLH